MIELGRLPGDTIADRQWRIVVEQGSYRLECQALVPGGWKEIATEPDLMAIRRWVAWLGMRIDAELTTPERARAAA